MKTKIKLSHKKKVSRKITKGNRVNRKITGGNRFKNKKRSRIINTLRGGSNPAFSFTLRPKPKPKPNSNPNPNLNPNPNKFRVTFPENRHSSIKRMEKGKPIEEGTQLLGGILSTNWRRTIEQRIDGLSYIELTDSLVQVNFKGLYIIMNLDVLSVDKLQYYLINKKLFDVSNDNKFLGLTENTILLKSLNQGGLGQYRTGSTNDFIDIYEDITSEIIPYEVHLNNLTDPKNHKFYINVKTIEYPELETIASEDVDWINEIMKSLNAIYRENNVKTNLEYFLELYKSGKITKNTQIFNNKNKNGIIECLDLNIDHTKLIIDDGGDNKLLIDGEEYVIVGYPAEKMRSYLDLLKTHEDDFKGIYDDHKAHFMEYMAQLHNGIYPNNQITNLETEIHKFYDYEKYYRYISKFYEREFTPEDKTLIDGKYPINAEYGIPYDPDFQGKFKELQEAFYNDLASKCLNKPMMKINYVFLIFKKYKKEGKYKNMYVPAIFNFRELQHKHHTILKRLEYLIKTRLAEIYKILSGTETDYKLWYAHYNYGDVFHIKTEYVHTMSNIQQQAYKYKNSINLEELIYMLSIPKVDLINLRLDYQRKEFRFNTLNSVDLEKKYDIDRKGKKFINKCNIDKKVDEKSKPKELLKLINLLNKTTKIVLMFVETGNSYTFVYKTIDNNFYIIKIKPNLCNIAIKLFNYLNKINALKMFYDEFYLNYNKEFIKSLNIQIDEKLELYEVLEHRLINKDDYKAIVRYNPLLVRILKEVSNKPINNNSISKTSNISIYFQSPLVDITKKKYYNILMPNPYFKKPTILRNFLATNIYIDEFQKFTNLIANNSTISYNYPINEIDDPNNVNNECSEQRLGDKPIDRYEFELIQGDDNQRKINRIFFNPYNCRYNFIEICDKIKNVVWIVPLNATYSEKIKEDNEEIFNNNIPAYLGTCLNVNKEHIYMLEIFNKIFKINGKECYFNIASIMPVQNSLHIHIFSKNYYKSLLSQFEQGSRLEKFINTNTVINFLKLGIKYNYEYYNNYKCELIIHHDK